MSNAFVSGTRSRVLPAVIVYRTSLWQIVVLLDCVPESVSTVDGAASLLSKKEVKEKVLTSVTDSLKGKYGDLTDTARSN